MRIAVLHTDKTLCLHLFRRCLATGVALQRGFKVFATFLQRFASPEMCLQRFCIVFATFYDSISEVP